jgi:hypothetical protein
VGGGGLLTAQNVTFRGNYCDDEGGGLAVVEAGAIIRSAAQPGESDVWPLNQFVGNSSTGFSVSFGGGAIFVDAGLLALWDSLIASNVAERGAGIYAGYDAKLDVVNCVICANRANGGTTLGSGMRLFGATGSVVHCTVVNNLNGGIEADAATGSALALTNCIVGGNVRTQVTFGFTVRYSDIDGGYPGAGNINLNPRVKDLGGDYRLTYGSPCIDTGTLVTNVPHDVVNVERPLGSGYDMGAYEYSAATMDSDDDTMIDAWELLYSLNPTNAADAAVDDDGDTYLNREEYIADTIPGSSNSFLRVTNVVRVAAYAAWFPCSARREYALQRTEDAVTGAWVGVAGQVGIPGDGSGSMSLADAVPASTCMVYRVTVRVP